MASAVPNFNKTDFNSIPIADSLPYLLSCLTGKVCAPGAVKVTPMVSSRTRYIQETKRMTTVPRFVHEAVMKNFLQPCLIVDPDLCANVEINTDFLRGVPMWKKLNPNQRVERCFEFIGN